jgi:hypothetical protein
VELFEILFILFILLIPLFEGIRKSRRRQEQEMEPGAPGRADRPDRLPQARRPVPHSRPAPREPESMDASGMVPDDLWEILTGERRQRPHPADVTVEDDEEIETPWPDDRDDGDHEPEWGPVADEPYEPVTWRDDPHAWRREPVPPQPPEALIAPPDEAPPTRRRPVPPLADVRRPRRKRSPLLHALHGPESLRQAVLLREILGQPKGLE